MSKYFDNKVCDRLCEAVHYADKKATQAHIMMELTPFGIGIRMKRGLFSNYHVVAYLDISEAKANMILPTIDNMIEQLLHKEAKQ
jgi:hypothetical protein